MVPWFPPSYPAVELLAYYQSPEIWDKNDLNFTFSSCSVNSDCQTLDCVQNDQS